MPREALVHLRKLRPLIFPPHKVDKLFQHREAGVLTGRRDSWVRMPAALPETSGFGNRFCGKHFVCQCAPSVSKHRHEFEEKPCKWKRSRDAWTSFGIVLLSLLPLPCRGWTATFPPVGCGQLPTAASLHAQKTLSRVRKVGFLFFSPLILSVTVFLVLSNLLPRHRSVKKAKSLSPGRKWQAYFFFLELLGMEKKFAGRALEI